jgi:hypothetical protein
LKRLVFLTTLLVCSTAVTILAQDSTFIPGRSYFGSNNYIEYIAGNSPYIISAPHDGFLTPTEIPDRTGNVPTDHDSYIQDLIRKVGQAVFAREGRYPHIIICHLARIKLDADRDLAEAAQGNPFAVQAWKEYHSFIDTAAQLVQKNFERGFYIDLHGYSSHPIQRLELGYILSRTTLSLTDAALDNSSYGNSSSIRTMIPASGLSLSQLLRGPRSLGSFFENRGYPAVPSEMQPNPGSNGYFNGGYNTQRHGSLAGGPISGVQIECNMTGVRDTEDSRRKFADAFAEAIYYYTAMHLFQKPTTTSNLVINEVMFDVPADGDANGDGVRSLRGDEFVEIVNAGTTNADISGYRILERDARTIFTFPPNVVLKPNEYTVVFGGVKTSGFGPMFPLSLKLFAAKPGQADSGFYASSTKTNLLGAGDNVILLNPQANDIMDEVYWGSAVAHSKKGKKLVRPFTVQGDSIAGAIAQSVTRSPEITGLWTLHKSASAQGLPYSPGTSSNPLVFVAGESDVPGRFILSQNYPNPFNPRTAISFQLSANSIVTLRVFDLLGREVATLADGEKAEGRHTAIFDATGVPSGVYYYRLEARQVSGGQSRNFVDTKKLVVLK